MKKYFLAYFFIIISSLSYAQTVNGRLGEFESDTNPFDSILTVTLQIKLNENESAILGHAFNLKFSFDSLSLEFIQGTYINFNEVDGYKTSPITNPGNSRTIQNIETELISGAGREVNDAYIDFVMFEFKIIDFSQAPIICPMNNIYGFHFYSPGANQDWIIGEWTCFEPSVPVELTSFTAVSNSNNVILSWKTATELNNLGFELERKLNDSEWKKIGYVEGYGTTTEPQSYSYSDNNLAEGKYYYRLKQVDINGSYEYSETVEVIRTLDVSFSLEQNYPNPFNPVTTIYFSVPNKSDVKLTIYNLLGKEIKTLVNEEKERGSYSITFNASDLASGMYLYKLQAGSFVETKKMVLLK